MHIHHSTVYKMWFAFLELSTWNKRNNQNPCSDDVTGKKSVSHISLKKSVLSKQNYLGFMASSITVVSKEPVNCLIEQNLPAIIFL